MSYKELEKYYKCPICLELMTEACTTACGHNFCYNCIIAFKLKCTICKRVLSNNELMLNDQLKKSIESIKIMKESEKYSKKLNNLYYVNDYINYNNNSFYNESFIDNSNCNTENLITNTNCLNLNKNNNFFISNNLTNTNNINNNCNLEETSTNSVNSEYLNNNYYEFNQNFNNNNFYNYENTNKENINNIPDIKNDSHSKLNTDKDIIKTKINKIRRKRKYSQIDCYNDIFTENNNVNNNLCKESILQIKENHSESKKYKLIDSYFDNIINSLINNYDYNVNITENKNNNENNNISINIDNTTDNYNNDQYNCETQTNYIYNEYECRSEKKRKYK
jgi:hypothetical protein